MQLEKKTSERSSIKKEIQYSFAFHAIVLGFFSIKSVFFPSEDIDYRSAVRVDIVALPDKIEAPSPPAPKKPEPVVKKPEPKPEPKKPVEVVKPKDNTVDLRAKQQSAIDRMQALEKLKAEKELQESQQSAIQRLQEFKGNQLSAGSSLDGVMADQFNAYVGELDNFIKQYWDLPRWLAETKITCSVNLKIDSRGYVIFRQISRPSGNPDYDDIALKAIDAASPFPPPPSHLASTLQVKGFTIEFDNREN